MYSEPEALAHEEAFVNAFIDQDRRERLLFELRKHRGRFLQRFNDPVGVLDPRFVTVIKPPNSHPEQILKLLKSKGAPDTCYSISTRDELDGRFMPLAGALKLAVGWGMPSIVSCRLGELVYLETEQEAGPPNRYLLHRPCGTHP